MARKRPDFGPISLLSWPVCVSNGAVVHVDGQQSKKMHGQQNSEALNKFNNLESRVRIQHLSTFFIFFKMFLGQKKAPLSRGLLAKRRSLSTFWPPTAHWVVGAQGAAVDVHLPRPFIYESTSYLSFPWVREKFCYSRRTKKMSPVLHFSSLLPSAD